LRRLSLTPTGWYWWGWEFGQHTDMLHFFYLEASELMVQMVTWVDQAPGDTVQRIPRKKTRQ
jgi:hypothetical protein